MINKKRRLLVTGLTGQVSQSLRQLSPSNSDIFAVGRPHFDLTSRESIFECLGQIKCDAIINAAAFTDVDNAEINKEAAWKINADGAGFIADVAAHLGIPLLHISTDYVFDGKLSRPYHEQDPTGPVGVYGQSKLEGERQIVNRHDNYIILRTAWVYSPFGRNFVKTILRLRENKNELSIVDDQIGNPTYAIDLASSIVKIAERILDDKSIELRGIYHITGSDEGSWADFAEEIIFQTRKFNQSPVYIKRIATTDYPTIAKRPSNSRLDNTKLEKNYNIKLPSWKISLEDCISKIYQPEIKEIK